MIEDPLNYWQTISENYRHMSDGELLELAASPADLTEVAQQVLRDEMKKRGLSERRSPGVREAPGFGFRGNFDPLAGPFAGTSVMPSHSGQEDDLPHEYTWKTMLCECGETVQAQQLAEALERAGIESWVEAPSRYSIDLSGPRVLVAADQIEEARAVAARPIPVEIIEYFKTEIPEFELPMCPRCGAAEPILEGTEHANTWCCEVCGAEWGAPDGVPSDAATRGEISTS